MPTLCRRILSRFTGQHHVSQLPRWMGKHLKRLNQLQRRTTGVVHLERWSKSLPTRVHLCRQKQTPNALSKWYVHQQHGFRLLHSLFTGNICQQRSQCQMRQMPHGVFTIGSSTIKMYSSRRRINRGQRRICLGHRTKRV